MNWFWGRDEYAELLKKSGGQQRIADYATARGEAVNAEKLHRRKTQFYADAIQDEGLTLRPGVSDVVKHARSNGAKLVFATTTSRDNIDAIFAALNGTLDASSFDLITDRSQVGEAKPSPDVFKLVLARLALSAQDCVAIEDTPTSLSAATAAGLPAIAFPGAYADATAFEGAEAAVEHLTIDAVMGGSVDKAA
ncbi:HAD-IA family hydrolase [Tropicimonas sp. S265A]|uniref:HAD-IA family hydrolase n=1 Tax=Tropicimonas sp. S265A TaxID=3415134 RepID=UPI003C7C7CB0